DLVDLRDHDHDVGIVTARLFDQGRVVGKDGFDGCAAAPDVVDAELEQDQIRIVGLDEAGHAGEALSPEAVRHGERGLCVLTGGGAADGTVSDAAAAVVLVL